MHKINGNNNFCRVFLLPDDYPHGYCFGGGHKVLFLMVDWFNPIPFEDIEFGIKPWDQYEEGLKEFLLQKNYVKNDKQYLVITDFGKSFIFQKER